MTTKKRTAQEYRISAAPSHEKLPWPGLKAKDHLSRVVTRAVKEAKEAREAAFWAEKQIARVLDHVPPETAARILFREISRRGKPRIARIKRQVFADNRAL
jgi:hypothetical protein